MDLSGASPGCNMSDPKTVEAFIPCNAPVDCICKSKQMTMDEQKLVWDE